MLPDGTYTMYIDGRGYVDEGNRNDGMSPLWLACVLLLLPCVLLWLGAVGPPPTTHTRARKRAPLPPPLSGSQVETDVMHGPACCDIYIYIYIYMRFLCIQYCYHKLSGYCPICNDKNYEKWEAKFRQDLEKKRAKQQEEHRRKDLAAAAAAADQERAATAAEGVFEYSNGDVCLLRCMSRFILQCISHSFYKRTCSLGQVHGRNGRRRAVWLRTDAIQVG